MDFIVLQPPMRRSYSGLRPFYRKKGASTPPPPPESGFVFNNSDLWDDAGSWDDTATWTTGVSAAAYRTTLNDWLTTNEDHASRIAALEAL